MSILVKHLKRQCHGIFDLGIKNKTISTRALSKIFLNFILDSPRYNRICVDPALSGIARDQNLQSNISASIKRLKEV
jgi:hypothetical protein